MKRIIEDIVNMKIAIDLKLEDTKKKPFIIDSSDLTAKLKPEDINYFDSTIEGERDIINLDKYVIYKDIY